MMNHTERTRAAFTRQAGAMAAHRLFTSGPVLDWLRTACHTAGGGRVLDPACGPGILAAELAPTAASVTGVDLTPRMLRLAVERCAEAGVVNASFAEATVDRLPFPDGAFDCVVTRLSFHHFADLPSALAQMRRVLRAGGTLLAADIVSSSDPDESRLHNALENLRDPSHVWMPSEASLLSQLESAGLRVRSVESYRQEREYSEWASIVEGAASSESLEVLMRRFAAEGVRAGIDLRINRGALKFDHHWRLIIANAV